VAPTAPAIFTGNSSGAGTALAFNGDSTPNRPDNPAPIGSILAFTATGEGQTDPPGQDGFIAGDAPPAPIQQVSVRIGGVNAPVISAGGAPGLAAGFLHVPCAFPTMHRLVSRSRLS
jgi:uncharacterized protein (TIGR03437 family)